MPPSPDRDAGVRTLVLGGIRSGKSDWAESAMTTAGPVRYIATGPAADGEAAWAWRVAEHRRRRPPGWHTVETQNLAAELRACPDQATLVDDVGCWLTAVLDRRGWDAAPSDPDADPDADPEVAELLAAVGAFAAPLTLVSPEVGLAVVPATAAGRVFADELGRLNRRLAALCDQVVLVVAGQPVWIKPSPGSR